MLKITNDSIKLFDGLNDMFIDEHAKGRSFIGISATLVAAQLILSNLCISCTRPECEAYTWKSLVRLADLDVVETPQGEDKNVQCDGGLLDSILEEDRPTLNQ